jgi:hypothetical protein
VKLIIEPTPELQHIDGVPHRVWEGQSDSGVAVKVYVRAVEPQTHDPDQLSAFERALQALPEPIWQLVVTDLRFVS